VNEYERILKAEKLHRSLLRTLLRVNKKGTETVTQNERRLVKVYEKRRKEIEKLVWG